MKTQKMKLNVKYQAENMWIKNVIFEIKRMGENTDEVEKNYLCRGNHDEIYLLEIMEDRILKV